MDLASLSVGEPTTATLARKALRCSKIGTDDVLTKAEPRIFQVGAFAGFHATEPDLVATRVDVLTGDQPYAFDQVEAELGSSVNRG